MKKSLSSRLPTILALAVSALALIISFLGYRLTAVRSVKPVVVTIYRNDSGWHVKNIGNGPALNVLVAQGNDDGEWSNPVRVPPLAREAEFHLAWLRHSNVRWIGVSYTDIDGRQYSSETSDDLTRVRRGRVFPQWPDDEIGRYWEEPDERY